MAIVIVIVLFLIVAIVAGAGIGWAFYNDQPENAVLNSVVACAEDFTEREELSFILSTLENGMVEVDIKSMDVNGFMGLHAMERADIHGKLYFSEDVLALQDFSFKTEDRGDEYDVNLGGDVYISDGFVCIDPDSEPGGAYGIELDNAADELRNSIFAYGSGSKYAIADQEEFNELVSLYEKLRDRKIDNEKMIRDAERILDKYFKEVWDIVFANAELTDGETNKLLDGSEGSYRVITLKMDADRILNAVEEVYQFVKTDSSVRDFLDKYEAELAAYELFADDENNPGKTLSEKYSYAVAEWGSTREEFKEELINDRVFEDISIEFVITKHKYPAPWNETQLLQFGYSINTYTSFTPIDFTVCFSEEGIANTDHVVFSGSEIGDIMRYEITENSDKSYKLIGTLKKDKDDEEEIEFFTLELDRTTGAYSMRYGTDKIYTKLSGECKREGDTLELSITNIHKRECIIYNYGYYLDYHYYENDYPTKINLAFTRGVEMPEAPTEYKTLSEITEGEVDSWVEHIEKIYEEYGYVQ